MEIFAKKILGTANSMRDQIQQVTPAPNFIPLRELSNYCLKNLFESNDKFIRLICFYLYSFINNVFSNLGGDTPYDEQLQRVRRDFYTNFIETLSTLGQAIQEDNRETVMDCLACLTDDYIDKINFLNSDFE